MVKKGKGIGDLLLGHCIAFLFCVLFPGFVTAVAPVSWISFVRDGEKVVAKSKICTLFFIPYQIKTIDPVVGVGDRFVAGKFERRAGERDRVRTEDEAFLLIHGESDTAKVPVSPVNIKSVTQRSQAFLEDKQATHLNLFVVANWKFSIFGGGLVSLLTVLYVVGIVLSIFQGVRRLFGFISGSGAERYSANPK